MSVVDIRSFFERMFGIREDFWLKDGNTVSVCSCLLSSAESACQGGKMTKLASRAEKEVVRMVDSAGIQIYSKGAFMRSHGRRVTAVGVAEIKWSPEVEKALESRGLLEAK